MNIAVALLRLIHILSGVFWAGGVFTLAGFVQPTAQATAPESGKFMQRLLGGPLTIALSAAGPLTILAGLILYVIDSGGLRPEWIVTPTGLGFTLGALAGLAALGIGFFISRTDAVKLTALGKEIQAAGKPPTPEQAARLGALQKDLVQATVWTAVCLLVAVAAMATARYL
jgi:uncharacterized membrane protein